MSIQSFFRFFERVIHIQITKNIDVKQANRIYRHLEGLKNTKTAGVVVSINSKGGCITQSKNISSAIKQFAANKNVPLFAFAQDMCLNSANIILTSAKNCYASKFSLMGDFGYYNATLGFQNLIKDMNVGFRVLRSGENKAVINPLQQLREEDRKWMQNYLYSLQYQLRVNVIKNRASQFKRLELSKQTIQSQILQNGIIRPQNAVKLGLIDGIKTVDQLLAEKFQGVKVIKINPPKYSLGRVFDIKNLMQDL